MTFEKELASLKLEFERRRKAKGKVIFPDFLKLRAVSLLGRGCPMDILCRECDLRAPQVYSWKAGQKLKKTHTSPTDYSIREIPIVPPFSNLKKNFVEPQKQKRKILLRFWRVKILWG